MTPSQQFQRIRWPAAILSLLFFCAGLAFLPLAGIEADEALFGAAIYYQPQASIFHAHVFGREIPLMLLSYLGALKSWIFFPILDRIQPSYLSIRLPALLMGTVTVWLFVRLLEKLHGRKVAWAGGALLATDTMFLLTTCYDWGPVALQHLLTLAGILSVLGFAKTGKRSSLFWGFLCFGLAFWDKALFIWLFSGLAVATLAVFPREVKSRWSARNLGLAAAGIILGALPLIAYNVVSGFATVRSASTFVLSQFPSRLHALAVTWDGEILFGYLAHAPWTPGNVRAPGTALFAVSRAVHALVGFRYHYYNALGPAFLLGLLLVPLLFLRRARTPARRAMLFCLIAMAVAWLQMAFTKDAGLGAHHVVLLWPFPHWFLAVALVEAAEWPALRWKPAGAILLAVVVSFLAVDNLLLTNEYYYQLAAYGANRSWDDAIFQLSEVAGHIQAPELAVYDWGILNQLIVLHRNRVPLYWADETFLTPAMRAADRKLFMKRLAEDVWIGHTAPFEQWPGVNEKVERDAQALGLEKRTIETVEDRNGRAVFQIFRFVKRTGP